MYRRQFIAAAAAGTGLLASEGRKKAIGGKRISAISDDVATSLAEAISFARKFAEIMKLVS
jgi:hypothetical protein